jgi:PBSX family phage portal protein
MPGKISARIIKAIKKAATSNQVQSAVFATGLGLGLGDDFISHPTDLRGYKTMVSNSTILPQCVSAYKNNIAGFGIAVRYKHDEKETNEMKAEWDMIKEVIELLNMDQDTKEVFEDLIEAREKYGIAYLEVIRNLNGEVAGIEFIRDTPTIHKTSPLEPYVEVEYALRGRLEKRPKRFIKYRQQSGGKTVFFKEMGDPRIMNKRDGKYSDGTPLEYRANEILEFAIGVETYGEVRWTGQILGADGSRSAEVLNNRYFKEGRHTPMMILINGGTLTADSFDKLQGYMSDIKGESGQHAFIVLEAAEMTSKAAFEGEASPTVQIVPMAAMLQKDELFQEYQDNHRRKVQSAFRLPDLYIGYTTDFNRATAISAIEVTEQQVFQPERDSLAWVINNKLLRDYNFQHVEAFFEKPDISNVDDMVKLLNVAERAGGITPNKAKELTHKAMGGTAENYDGEWGDIPLQARKITLTAQAAMGLLPNEMIRPPDDEKLDLQLDQQIMKATLNKDDEIAIVLKEVRNLLRDGEVA